MPTTTGTSATGSTTIRHRRCGRLRAETLAMADCSLDDIGAFDLYSCFPSAVEIGCKEMGLAEDDPRGLTVTGGLPYFGGPGNNYVTHSIAEMMNRVRANPGMRGMVTANGNYVTKQSGGIYSTTPPERPFAPKPPKTYQARDRCRKGPGRGRDGVRRRQRSRPTRSCTSARGRPMRSCSGAMHRGAGSSRTRLTTTTLLADMTTRDYLGAPGTVQTNDDGVNIFNRPGVEPSQDQTTLTLPACAAESSGQHNNGEPDVSFNARPEHVREQIYLILTAWGMTDDLAATTADVMLETDLIGVDFARHFDAHDLRDETR